MTKLMIDYQKLTAELETILDSLQSGTLSKDEAIDAYDRAQKIVLQLQEYLAKAENKIKKITALKS